MQVSVEEMLKPDEARTLNTEERKNLFFNLQKDGDSAIVRFLQEDINDFEVLDVHNIPLNGYNRKINCLRTSDQSKDMCPICKANTFDEEKRSFKYPLQRKFFIHLLKYNSPTEAEEQIWERSKDYIRKLNQFVEDYGPLCDRLYKIVRHGAAGSMDTSYDILPLDKDRYNPANYAFDRVQLKYKSAIGTSVLNKTNEEIEEYLQTGNFPGFKKTESEVTPRPQPQAEVNSNSNNNYPFDEPRRRV